jgi:hypothetical protein
MFAEFSRDPLQQNELWRANTLSELRGVLGDIQGRAVDFQLGWKRDADRGLERQSKVVDRLETFTQPPPGERGERGPPGVQGERGEPGDPGQPGATGAEGPIGPQGPQGERGPQGARGESGLAGAPGEIGAMGQQGPQGERGPQGARGEPGQAGLPGEVGPAGPQGPQGERGSQGARGEPGERGFKGERGDPGEKGEKGERGLEGPAGRLPLLEDYQPKRVYYQGDCVTFMGGAYQAIEDTGEPPTDREAWRQFTASGRDGASLKSRGTYSPTEDYRALDVVMLNGSSFVALHDSPGECPNRDGWQCLAMVGKRGDKGEAGPKGAKGDHGERGERGAPGVDGKHAPTTVAWRVDRDTYTVIPINGDRSDGAPLELRGLFEQFESETGQ